MDVFLSSRKGWKKSKTPGNIKIQQVKKYVPLRTSCILSSRDEVGIINDFIISVGCQRKDNNNNNNHNHNHNNNNNNITIASARIWDMINIVESAWPLLITEQCCSFTKCPNLTQCPSLVAYSWAYLHSQCHLLLLTQTMYKLCLSSHFPEPKNTTLQFSIYWVQGWRSGKITTNTLLNTLLQK